MIEPDLVKLSPNFSPGMPNGKLVVIHATRSDTGSLNPTEFEGTLNWFRKTAADDPNAGTSAHWVVARDGRKARVVLDTNKAQHAVEHNLVAWGIELEQSQDGDGFTEAQIAALVSICKGYVEDFGVAVVHTLEVTKSGFIGHEETPQGKRVGKTDPGKQFDWAEFIELLGEDEMPMKTHNVVAGWWTNNLLPQSAATANDTMQALSDFGLPAGAKRVRFGVYLSAGAGYLRFFNGDGTEAEPVGWGSAKPAFGAVEVTLGANGTVAFRVEDGPVTTAMVRSLGYAMA